jgi:hypothetical protein
MVAVLGPKLVHRVRKGCLEDPAQVCERAHHRWPAARDQRPHILQHSNREAAALHTGHRWLLRARQGRQQRLRG